MYLLGLILLLLQKQTLGSRETTEVWLDTKPAPELKKYDIADCQHMLNNPCRLRVNKASAINFERTVQLYRPNFARLVISFPPNVNYTVKPNVLLADHMYWTFFITEGIFPYLKWPRDFTVLSFGTLDKKSLHQQLWLVFETFGPPDNCSIIIGDRATQENIGCALKSFTKTYLMHNKYSTRGYSFSYWCNLEVVKDLKNTVSYYLALHFGFQIEAVQYSCCKTNFYTSHFGVICLPLIKPLHEYTLLSVFLALALYLFFPMLLFRCCGKIKNSSSNQNREGSSRQHNIGAEGRSESDTEGWLFLTGSPPICMSNLLIEMGGLYRNHPAAASRICRCLFAFLTPVIIYVQLYIYYHYLYEYTMARIEHNIPLGFLSMLGGFQKGKELFCPYLGGPHLLLLGYHVTSLIFLVFPKSINKVLLDGMTSSNWEHISPICWGVEKLEKISMLTIKSQLGYTQLYRQSLAGLYMLFNPKFWCCVYFIQENRIRRLFNHLSSCCNKTVLVLCLMPCVPVYVVLCFVEYFICFVYFLMPLFNCMRLIVVGYVYNFKTFLQRWEENHCISQPSRCTGKYIRYSFVFVSTVLFLYFILCCHAIFLSCFSFMAQIIVFSFIAVIVYPSVAFGYLFFGSVLLYYIVNMFQKVGAEYLELLADAVEISIDLQAEHSFTFGHFHDIRTHIYPDSRRLRRHSHRLSTSHELSIQGPASYQQMDGTHVELVKYKEHTVGIPYPLFYYLVTKHRPVHIEVAKAIIKLTLTCLLIACAIRLSFAQAFGANAGISEVMHVVFIVVIGALPRILEIALSNENHALRKEINNRKIRASVMQFWKLGEQGVLVE